MTVSVELQVISKILMCNNEEEIEELLSFDDTYYSVFKKHIQFILNHKAKYGVVPDVFTFLSEFQDVEQLLDVREPASYLKNQMRLNKERIILVETINRVKDADESDIENVWAYISNQVERINKLDTSKPMDIIHQAKERSDQIVEYNKRAKIPSGFAEIDKCMYGGLSTVEELLLIIARTGTGKSWTCTKMMESAQRHGFPVLYYSPEMQSSFLATRFDTWRGQFTNSDLFRGQYSNEYIAYLKDLENQETPAYILEDKDVADGVVDVKKVQNFVHQNGIKLCIIDGLSYMEDVKHGRSDYEKYKNIAAGLFRMSKEEGCAVVIAMQANRQTKENATEDGKPPFPSLFEVEGSDHPGRIATQAFSLRQVYDKHLMEIRLEKSRNAANQKPVFSYSWDPNTGTMSLVDDADEGSEPSSPATYGTPVVGPVVTSKIHVDDDILDDDDDFDDDTVEF